LFETRKKEHALIHERKLRLTNEDIRKGTMGSAEERMEKEGGGLARHSVKC
jgi:hypothetical protein